MSEPEPFPLAVCRKSVLRQALRITGDLSGAEDVLQELLVNLMGISAVRRETICSFDRYIAASVRNLAVRWCKKHRGPMHEPLSGDLYERTVEECTELVENESEMNSLMERIPQGCREVLICFYVEECTAEEVATHVGISTAAVKKRLQRAAAKLRPLGADYRRRARFAHDATVTDPGMAHYSMDWTDAAVPISAPVPRIAVDNDPRARRPWPSAVTNTCETLVWTSSLS